ncbi:hypothetical protein Hanom_Chr02g00167471 [Helianthus anomalus]
MTHFNNLLILTKKKKNPLTRPKKKNPTRLLVLHSSYITTIDPNNLTVNPLSSVTNQEPDQRSNILRHPQPTQRVFLHYPIHHLLTFPFEKHFCRNWPRSYTVRCDSRSL